MTFREKVESIGQSQAAAELGVTRSAVNKIMAGRNGLSAAMLARARASWPDFDVAATLDEEQVREIAKLSPAARAAALRAVVGG